jgi:hypothetical protein
MSRTVRRKTAWDKSRYSDMPRHEYHGDRHKSWSRLFPIKLLWRRHRARARLALYNAVRVDNLDEYLDPLPKESVDPWFID